MRQLITEDRSLQRSCQHDMRFVCLQTANGVEQVRNGCVNCGYRTHDVLPHRDHPNRGTYPLITQRVEDYYDRHPRWEYQAYMRSEAWLERREAAKARCGRRCQLCGATDQPLQVHHNTYKRLGAELETDLTVLCDGCHGAFHDRAELAEQRARREAA